MQIHKEGKKNIITASIILLVIALNTIYIPVDFIFKAIIVLPFVVLFLLILWFFRIPERESVKNESIIIAPADGKIVVIEKIVESEYFKDERIQISIFMSPLNVHQNTYPVSGKVVYKKHHKGKYLVAWHPKSSALNEQCSVVVKNDRGEEIMVKQIAGAVARRICNYSQEGKKVNQCDELGFIKFGSRVDIILPVSAKILCKMNQVSRNKITKIAQLS
jgi:phosphatidylserine decarboxylase